MARPKFSILFYEKLYTYISLRVAGYDTNKKTKINAEHAKKYFTNKFVFTKSWKQKYFTLPLSVAAAPTAVVAMVRDPATADAKTNV